jgi:hypothetical protein
MPKTLKVEYGDRIQWFDESLDEWVDGVVTKGVYDIQPFVSVRRSDTDEYEYVDLRFAKVVQ